MEQNVFTFTLSHSRRIVGLVLLGFDTYKSIAQPRPQMQQQMLRCWILAAFVTVFEPYVDLVLGRYTWSTSEFWWSSRLIDLRIVSAFCRFTLWVRSCWKSPFYTLHDRYSLRKKKAGKDLPMKLIVWLVV